MGRNYEKMFQSMRLLVVEDNEFTAMTACKTLKSIGAQHVETAANGHEALRILYEADDVPDVILMDLRMPGMGGLELLTRLKEGAFKGRIIVMSGVDDEIMKSVEQMVERDAMDVLGFLSKPLKAEALKELLAKTLDQKNES